MNIPAIKDEANKKGLAIEWVVPTDQNYDESRRIANAVFSYKPAAIAYCKDSDAVAGLFQIFKKDPPKFRIRSGGHQHEGMCTADGVLLIDLSKINTIEIDESDPEKPWAWIPPGCSLGEVYAKVWGERKVFPGGGCSGVHTGGLIQGGGWGLWARKFGLSCDNLLEAEIVLADGRKVLANENNYPDLFWALRGGGGGNFGVVTNFKVRLHPAPFKEEGKYKPIFFRFMWRKKAQRREVLQHWLVLQEELPREVTSFCRLSIPFVEESANQESAIIGGAYYGTKEQTIEFMRGFISEFPKPDKTTPPIPPDAPRTAAKADLELDGLLAFADLVADLQPGPPRLAAPEAGKAPSNTCNGSYPHKVSSAWPAKSGDYDSLAEGLVRYLDATGHDPAVHRYVSFLGLGGAVGDKAPSATAFPHRNKAFLMQFQAWWSDPKSSSSESYKRWVVDFRKSLGHDVEGGFINFADAGLTLKDYYGSNLAELRRIKDTYDPRKLFSFPMGIR